MMQSIIPWIGVCAAVFTSFSYIPQVQKARPRGSTKDLSLKMLGALTAGLLLWIGYGLLKSDWVIVAANSVGAVGHRAGLQNSRPVNPADNAGIRCRVGDVTLTASPAEPLFSESVDRKAR